MKVSLCIMVSIMCCFLVIRSNFTILLVTFYLVLVSIILLYCLYHLRAREKPERIWSRNEIQEHRKSQPRVQLCLFDKSGSEAILTVGTMGARCPYCAVLVAVWWPLGTNLFYLLTYVERLYFLFFYFFPVPALTYVSRMFRHICAPLDGALVISYKKLVILEQRFLCIMEVFYVSSYYYPFGYSA